MSSISTPGAEFYYWVTIMFSQTLGTAAIFGASLLVVVVLHCFSDVSGTALFWSAFVLTRPLGAVVGDYLDKPVAEGGLELSRYTATGVLLAAIVVLVLILPQRSAERGH